jgi:hypothetical protein
MCSQFFDFFENDILRFQRNVKEIPDVYSDVIYQCEKFQLETPNILGYTKRIFRSFQNLHCSLPQIWTFVILCTA